MAELIARNLSHRHGNQATVRGVDLALSSGRVHALLGPTGAGKSTLMKVLAGLLTPASGTVEERADDEMNHTARLGVVFEPAGLWDHMTVAQHLRLVLKPSGLSAEQRESRITRYLERLDLIELRDRVPAKLSSGQQQRLAIARALAVEPRWLLLDEPLSHLDGAARIELLDLLGELLAQSNAGVLLITHLPNEAMAIADDLSLMINGRIVQTGEPAQVYREPVNLKAARLLGEACELTGEVRGGVLMIGGVEALNGVAGADGPRTLILRDAEVRFIPDNQGPATIKGCRFVAGTHLLRIGVAGVTVISRSNAVHQISTKGRLELVKGPVDTLNLGTNAK